MGAVDRPWLHRLSEHFVLSDFMYSDSIIRRGLRNVYYLRDVVKANRTALVELLDHIADEYGHLSIVYGYIDHKTSMKTVKWRDPAKPSYHRWDDGAAADIIVHEFLSPERERNTWKLPDDPDASPAMLAREIASAHDFSRMIVYSESPSICIAAKHGEVNPRRAYYENAWQGQPGAKPKYMTHSYVPTRKSIRERYAEKGWQGRGYPSYHGGGRLQYHHVRIGRYLTLLECLRNPIHLARGIHNRPPVGAGAKTNFMKVAHAMSRWMEWYYHYVGMGSLSVIQGHSGANLGIENLHTPGNMDWGEGNGYMVFAIDQEFAPEMNMAWKKHRMEDYILDYEGRGDSTFIVVQWRKH